MGVGLGSGSGSGDVTGPVARVVVNVGACFLFVQCEFGVGVKTGSRPSLPPCLTVLAHTLPAPYSCKHRCPALQPPSPNLPTHPQLPANIISS